MSRGTIRGLSIGRRRLIARAELDRYIAAQLSQNAAA